MNAGGYLHHDDLACYETCLREVAATFGPALKVCEIGIFSGHTSRSVREVLLTTTAADYEHWCVDNRVEDRGVWEPPFPGCNCVWKDSHDAAPEVPNGLGLVLIDGCHCLHHVLGDWWLYSPKVLPGGLVLFHDANVQSQGKQYQRHGDEHRSESHISVLGALESLNLVPCSRPGWELAHVGGDGGTWWGGMLAFRRKAVQDAQV